MLLGFFASPHNEKEKEDIIKPFKNKLKYKIA